MLGIDDGQKQTIIKPWLPALLLEDQLYLFDAGLGVPIPAQESGGVATLSDVLEKPELLRFLDVKPPGEEMIPYPVASSELTHVVALIDAPPQALSVRMQMVEANLAGERKRELAIDASDLAARLAKCPGVTEAKLWNLPFETAMYAAVLPQALQNSDDRRRKLYEDIGAFESTNPLVQARYRHFRGELSSTDDVIGAKNLYVSMRMPDSQLDELLSSKPLQKALGLEFSLPKSEKLREVFLQRSVVVWRNMKHNASFWLGLAHYDAGDYRSAEEWFQRVLEAPRSLERWKHASHYNLARCYEAAGDLAKARDKLRDDDTSPQQAGNLVRVKVLQNQ